ncbi:MAG: PadR family transcriptional regulator [Candidatus Bathyarchaeia archaeon]|jgi:DNA-binding PadR family transcriptional regulator
MNEDFAKELRCRMLSNFLDVIILLILNGREGCKYPTKIKHFCEETFGLKIAPNSLYSILVMLERKGLIKGETKQILEYRSTRFYHLTPEGKDVLETFFLSHDEMMFFLKLMNDNTPNLHYRVEQK